MRIKPPDQGGVGQNIYIKRDQSDVMNYPVSRNLLNVSQLVYMESSISEFE